MDVFTGMADSKRFRKNSARNKSKGPLHRIAVTIPREIWTYIQEKKLQEFQAVTTKGGAGTNMTDTGVETVCEIDLHADSKQSLSKAVAAFNNLTNGIVIRKYRGVMRSDRKFSDYPDVLVKYNGEMIIVIGPEPDIMYVSKMIHPPLKVNLPQLLPSGEPFQPLSPTPVSPYSTTGGFPPPASPTTNPASSPLVPVTFHTERGQRIHVQKGDITKMRVNIIVNAANEQLQNNGGVSLAISRAAGPELQRDCDQYIGKNGPLEVTCMAVTPGYNLPARRIFHVVGPHWQGADSRECTENLYVTFMNCLNQAKRQKASSIALPAISTGEHGAPPELVTEQMCRAVLDFCHTESSITDIYLVDINPQIPEMTARYLHNSRRVTLETGRPKSKYDTSGVQGNMPLSTGTGTSVGQPGSVRAKGRKGDSRNTTMNRSTSIPMTNGSHYETPANNLSPPVNADALAKQPLYRKIDKKKTIAIMSTKSFPPMIYRVPGGKYIHVQRKDITQMQVNVIVNATNEHLKHQGGVALAISQAAGPELQRECDQYVIRYGPILVSRVAVTRGYNLPASHVIHVVSPRWYGADVSEFREQLEFAFRNSLSKAASLKMSSIAIPALSSGVYGGPPEMVAELMCRAVLDFCRIESSITDIYLVDINPEMPELTARYLRNNSGVTLETERPRSNYDTTGAHGNRRRSTRKGSRSSRLQSDSSRMADAEQINGNTAEWGAHDAGNPTDAIAGHGSGVQMRRRSHKHRASSAGHGTGSRPISSGFGLEEDVFMPTLTTGRSNISNGQAAALLPSTRHDSQLTRPQPRSICRSSADFSNYYDRSPVRESITGECAICRDALETPVALNCGHLFCKGCIRPWLKDKPTCPCCRKVLGTKPGNQPNGTMNHTVTIRSLPGYRTYGTIEITYNFPNGIQQTNHPKPGHPYAGTNRQAFLPDSPEGREVLALLRKAFDARLLFTIGRSMTTGLDDQVVWNDVHHKTSRDGGPECFGYPDPTYLERVREELATKGIQ